MTTATIKTATIEKYKDCGIWYYIIRDIKTMEIVEGSICLKSAKGRAKSIGYKITGNLITHK